MKETIDIYFDNCFHFGISEIWKCSYNSLNRYKAFFDRCKVSLGMDYEKKWENRRKELEQLIKDLNIDADSFLSAIELPLAPKALPFHMSIGDISSSDFSDTESEQSFLMSRFEAEKYYQKNIESYENETETDDVYFCFPENSLKLLNEICDNKDLEMIRIWHGDNSDEMADFLFLMYRFRNCKFKIMDYKLPLKFRINGKRYNNYSWGQIEKDSLVYPISLGKILTEDEIQSYAKEWEKLVKDNSGLRIKNGDSLISVNEDYFDSYLLENMSSRKESVFNYASRISHSLNKRGRGVPSGFICSRLINMIDSGKINCTVKSKRTFFKYSGYYIETKKE